MAVLGLGNGPCFFQVDAFCVCLREAGLFGCVNYRKDREDVGFEPSETQSKYSLSALAFKSFWASW